jgi:hypothetical protein
MIHKREKKKKEEEDAERKEKEKYEGSKSAWNPITGQGRS